MSNTSRTPPGGVPSGRHDRLERPHCPGRGSGARLILAGGRLAGGAGRRSRLQRLHHDAAEAQANPIAGICHARGPNVDVPHAVAPLHRRRPTWIAARCRVWSLDGAVVAGTAAAFRRPILRDPRSGGCGLRAVPARIMIELVVFDLDGTLVDSSIDIANAANALVEKELGGTRLSHESIIEDGRRGGGGARPARAGRGVARSGDARRARSLPGDLQPAPYYEHTRPYDGMVDVLTWIAARTPTAVLTNKPARATELMLDGLGTAALFRRRHRRRYISRGP